MDFYETLWTVLLFSFVGWCTEVAFAACKSGKFVNRGFLMGPVCPIYGFGVAAVCLLIQPIREHWFQAYLVAVFVPTVIEYLVGWVSFRLLHTRLWDYSKMPLNIGGHVCLLFSLIWGVACMVVAYFIHPLTLKLLHIIPRLIGWILAGVFSAALIADFILTSIQAAKLPKKFKASEELEAALRQLSEDIGSGVSEKTIALWNREKSHQEKVRKHLAEKHQARRDALMEKYQAQLEKPGWYYEHLRKAYPNLRKTEEDKHLKWSSEAMKQWKDRK